MAAPRRPAISDAEREVLRVLWEHGPGTVRELLQVLEQQGQRWSRSTVITLLQRVERKGYVASDRSGFAFVFRAIVSREDLARQRLSELAGELYAGDAAPMVLAFAEQHAFSDADLRQFRQMIEQLESKGRNRRKKR